MVLGPIVLAMLSPPCEHARMSATFYLFALLRPREMFELEAACEREVEAYLGAHPDCADKWGELSAGGCSVPTRQEVIAAYRLYGLDLGDAILERLNACKSSLLIDKPGDLDTDRLQVSVLRFLIERVGQGLVMFNDYPLVPTEEALAMLRKKRGAPGFVQETPIEHAEDH